MGVNLCGFCAMNCHVSSMGHKENLDSSAHKPFTDSITKFTDMKLNINLKIFWCIFISESYFATHVNIFNIKLLEGKHLS